MKYERSYADGEGLNATGFATVFHLDDWFNPSNLSEKPAGLSDIDIKTNYEGKNQQQAIVNWISKSTFSLSRLIHKSRPDQGRLSLIYHL